MNKIQNAGAEMDIPQDLTGSQPGLGSPAGAAEAGRTPNEMQAIWTSIQGQLLAEFGQRTFNSWLKPMHFVRIDGSEVVLGLPNLFMCDWIKSHFAERLRMMWASRLGIASPAMRFVVCRADAAAVQSPDADSKPPAGSARSLFAPEAGAVQAASSLAGSRASSGAQDHLYAPGKHADALTLQRDPEEELRYGSALEDRYTFSSFVVGVSNDFAYNAARRIADGGPLNFNPLFLHGGVGMGKTHLMHAIGWAVRAAKPDARVLYMTAEKFMLQFMAAIRHQDTIAFKQRFRTVDLLMIDDVQFIAGKESTQEEFFHTMNALIDDGRKLVISADRSPYDLVGIEERVRSRLQWGLVADINPADYELRLSILKAKLEGVKDIVIPDEVVDFLARRIASNVRDLEGALNRVIGHASLLGHPVTLEFTRQVLADLLRSIDRRTTIDEIQRKVAEYYGLKLAELLSDRRAKSVARPRQVAMYLAKRLTQRSLPEIGRKFGGRDHTTVMHAVKRIKQLRKEENELDSDVRYLLRQLDN